MNWDKAIELLESGDARMVVVQAVLLSVDGNAWISFDGKEWQNTDMDIVTKQFE